MQVSRARPAGAEGLDLGGIISDRSPADRARQSVGLDLGQVWQRNVGELMPQQREDVRPREAQGAAQEVDLAGRGVGPAQVARGAGPLVRRAGRVEEGQSGSRDVGKGPRETGALSAEKGVAVGSAHGATIRASAADQQPREAGRGRQPAVPSSASASSASSASAARSSALARSAFG